MSDPSSPLAAETRYGLTDRGRQVQSDLAQNQDWFTYHAPQPFQVSLMQDLREHFRRIADILVINLAPSRERSIALTELRQAAMLCNQAVIWEKDEA